MKQKKWSRLLVSAAIAACVGAALAGLAAPAAVQAAATAKAVQRPAILFGREMSGRDAVNGMGKLIDQVAKRAGVTTAQLKKALLSDPSLWVDRHGALYFVEPLSEEGLTGDGASAAPLAASAPSESEVFSLNSKPGSSRTIYLNFKGAVTSGTAWNAATSTKPAVPTITSPPFDKDGTPFDATGKPSFSEAERVSIHEIWQRVAENFAPFDVNVTTQAPAAEDINRTGLLDTRFGTMVVMTSPTNHPIGASCGCGGKAYVGNFNQFPDPLVDNAQHAYYQPAFVFRSPADPSTGATGTPDQFVAVSASHEAGHNLGLFHDGVNGGSGYYGGHGSGVMSWMPIMGGGSKSIRHWSKGEYPGANNSQDDYFVMASNGLDPRTDDVPDLVSTLLPGLALNPAPLSSDVRAGRVSVDQRGVIERASDVDYFKFSAGNGELSLQVLPAPINPGLNIRATLYTVTALGTTGTQLAQFDDPDGLGATVSRTLTAGNYALKIEGVADTDPSPGFTDYGSLGQYQIVGTFLDPDSAPPAAVASSDKTSGTAPLSVQFTAQGSIDPDGQIVTYAWNFGDGSSAANSFAPSHSYAKGSYTATLTVTDNSGLVATDSVDLIVYGTDTTPDPFGFGGTVGGVPRNSTRSSPVVTITGIDAPAKVAVTGGEYKVGSGAFTTAEGTITNGQTLQLRVATASTTYTNRSVTVTVGGVSATFTAQTGGQ